MLWLPMIFHFGCKSVLSVVWWLRKLVLEDWRDGGQEEEWGEERAGSWLEGAWGESVEE